ncbi:hypothetical protein SETIT_9G165500v2 [Setaria italica]|uniref:Uncharacterized protein n=1 Tax=Setaria italica TaxID=4555 RepID=A0A368SHE3_SETIT|nr:hypothetical protein SETIT_9G165500v2 [Setaria italica]
MKQARRQSSSPSLYSSNLQFSKSSFPLKSKHQSKRWVSPSWSPLPTTLPLNSMAGT